MNLVLEYWQQYSAVLLNFIMHWPNLWHFCMFLIFLGLSSSCS
uniref:Uncharacterized protein n=1 Tax=Anguilla anguilla TaxID=7936 RepID=A0A0E9SP52_ANGAN